MFKVPDARKLPTLVCTGVLAEIGKNKVSQSGDYIVQPYKLKAIGGRDMSSQLLYRPEWFTDKYEPSDESNTSYVAVYRNHIVNDTMLAADDRRRGKKSWTPSTLAGLSGSEGAFNQLVTLLTTGLAGQAEPDSDEIELILRDYLLGELQGTVLGYTLKQKRDKLDNGDYVLVDGYEVGGFFFADDKRVIEAHVKRAEKSPAEFKVAYAIPF